MHFYSFNIGDFAGSTLHLDWNQRAAFRALLDEYYLREQPLPLNARELYSRVRARTATEKKAVNFVLTEFFEQTAAGWTSARCEREIATSYAKRKRSSAGGHGRARKLRQGGAGLGEEGGGDSNEAAPPGSRQAGHGHAASTAPSPNPEPNPNPAHASSGAACGAAPPRVPPATDIPDPPRSVGDWSNFFRRNGFDTSSGLASPRLRAEMQRWANQGIGLALMREALDQARLRLGAMPDSPFYLVPIVAELAVLRDAPAAAQARPVIEDI